MLGRSLGDLFPGTLFVHGSERAAGLEAALDAATTADGPRVRRLGSDVNPLGWTDDVPFERRKVPSLLLTTGASPDRGTPRDAPERVDVARVAANARVLLALVRSLAGAPERPVWREDPPRPRAEVEALLEVVRRAEASAIPTDDDRRPVFAVLRGLLEPVAARGTPTLGERTAIRVAALQVLESLRLGVSP
jgi:hypothetical protein